MKGGGGGKLDPGNKFVGDGSKIYKAGEKLMLFFYMKHVFKKYEAEICLKLRTI